MGWVPTALPTFLVSGPSQRATGAPASLASSTSARSSAHCKGPMLWPRIAGYFCWNPVPCPMDPAVFRTCWRVSVVSLRCESILMWRFIGHGHLLAGDNDAQKLPLCDCCQGQFWGVSSWSVCGLTFWCPQNFVHWVESFSTGTMNYALKWCANHGTMNGSNIYGIRHTHIHI